VSLCRTLDSGQAIASGRLPTASVTIWMADPGTLRPANALRRSPFIGADRTWPVSVQTDATDPNVWSGRALQVDFAELAVGGLASMYPAFDWSVVLRAIMDISARAISLADRPLWAIRITSVRMRREDRTSISSHPLADLGR
jgi:hypothetical protein